MNFDEVTNEDNTAMVKDDVTLLIEAMRYQFLRCAEKDCQERQQGARFVIKNHNAMTPAPTVRGSPSPRGHPVPPFRGSDVHLKGDSSPWRWARDVR